MNGVNDKLVVEKSPEIMEFLRNLGLSPADVTYLAMAIISGTYSIMPPEDRIGFKKVVVEYMDRGANAVDSKKANVKDVGIVSVVSSVVEDDEDLGKMPDEAFYKA